MKKLTLIIGLVMATMILGCSKNEVETIRIGILPIEDSLPLVVAEDEGIFLKYGLKVELIPFNSALERDAALMVGEIDAAVTDPLAVILLRDKGYDIRIVSLCLGMNPDEGVFAILAAPNSTIESVEDLNGKKIAISSNTIIEYVTDVMLSKYNISYNKVEIKQIPMRVRILLDGKIDAATLPEPLASYAVTRGAKLILSDAMMEKSVTQTVIVFRGEFVDRKRDELKNFLKAYEDAVSTINSNKSKYRNKFIEIARIPENIAGKYPMPNYPPPKKLPKEFYDRYLHWALSKGLISREVPYEEVVANI